MAAIGLKDVSSLVGCKVMAAVPRRMKVPHTRDGITIRLDYHVIDLIEGDVAELNGTTVMVKADGQTEPIKANVNLACLAEDAAARQLMVQQVRSENTRRFQRAVENGRFDQQMGHHEPTARLTPPPDACAVA